MNKTLHSRISVRHGLGVTLLLSTILGLATCGWGQPGPEGAPDPSAGPPTGQPGERPMPPGPGAGLARVFPVLTPEQRASLREAMNANRDQTRQLDEQLRNAHEALFEASLAPKFDEEAVRQKAQAAAKLEAERNVVLARAFSQMKPPLSPEQMAKIKAAPGLGGFDQGRGNLERQRQGPNSARPNKPAPPKSVGQ